MAAIKEYTDGSCEISLRYENALPFRLLSSFADIASAQDLCFHLTNWLIEVKNARHTLLKKKFASNVFDCLVCTRAGLDDDDESINASEKSTILT